MARAEEKKIKLTKEQEKKAIEELIAWFDAERGETLGNLEGLMLLEFLLEKIGPVVYNQAIADAQRFLEEKTEDMYALML